MAMSTKKNAKKAVAKKTTAKKAVKKTAKKVTKKAVKKVTVRRTTATKKEVGPFSKKGTFLVEVTMNGETQGGFTDSIAETMQALQPDKLNTRLIARFSLAGVKDAKVFERVLNIHMARRVFVNKMSAGILEKAVKMSLGYNGE